MLSSDVALGHQHIHDGRSDGWMGHRSKKRNSPSSGHSRSLTQEIFPSTSPLAYPSASASASASISSPSMSSPSPLPPSPSTVEMEAEIDASKSATHLPKRIAIMNLVRPIPKRIGNQFYDEAYRNGSTLQETNQAAMMAHDWHRKWTYQDEANHTMPEEDFYQPTTTGIPISYGYNDVSDENEDETSDSDIGGVDADHHHPTNGLFLCMEREEGAKNPSLGSSPEEARKMRSPQPVKHNTKRHHSATIEQEQQIQQPTISALTDPQPQEFLVPDSDSPTEPPTSTDSSSQNSLSNHQAKKRFTESSNHAIIIDDDDYGSDQDNESDRSYDSYESQHRDDDDEEPLYGNNPSVLPRPLPIRPQIVRPVAIHANRPDYVLPQPSNGRLSPFLPSDRNGQIPRDIITNQFNAVEKVSPMSDSQLTGSSPSSSRSPLGSDMIGITVLETEHDGLCLVEENGELVPSTKNYDSDSISTIATKVEKARDDILHVLAINDGDVESKEFKLKLDPLEKYFLGKDMDTRRISRHRPQESVHASISSGSSIASSIEGMWLALSKPNFFGKLGQNDNGDPMYTLGRMSFDMFSPTNLVCSLQGNFNRVEVVSGDDRKAMLDTVPTKLREEVESGKTILRTYHVVTAFTIEPAMAAYPRAPNRDVIRPIRGIMTTYGYSLPDPDTPNRHSIWFTGGRIEPNNDITDILLWKNFFSLHPPNHSFGEKAKLLAVKLLMGATIPQEVDPDDGSMNYVFTRPLGGHGMAYVDVVYLDESLRIVRGQRGTTFVFSRVPDV